MLIMSNLAVVRLGLYQSLRIGIVSLALAMVFVAGARAQFGVPLNHSDPKMEPVAVRELVANYCRMDYSGARLDPGAWLKLQPLVSWKTNPDYPLIMVTSRFDVDAEPIPQHGKYNVTVHYRVLGRYDMGEGYSPESSSAVQDVQFAVSEVNGDWRITDVEPNYPHPSRAATMQWLNKKLAETQDPWSKTIYQHAVEVLQPQKASPPVQ